ncbi:UvrB/UvrC motif-containing protein [Tundrisphaera lichenicola]|uniref:UvrB/UvrC motif-containing protein n=1 Tax=Tundrisphaera lichenicola TaxID=2029860 RepID=UPI003EC14ABB
MSKDITAIVQGWDHDPDQFQVRIVAGDDGRDKLQMRVDLGLIQMELSGRPDGLRPHGFDSLLDFHEAKSHEVGSIEDYRLDSDDCGALMREGVQFYHRYLAAFHLGRFDLVARDTSRNLRLFAFVVKHATDRRDKVEFDRYRPYVTMMRARALSAAAIELGEHAVALKAVDEGIEGIRAFLREYDENEDQIECRELGRLIRLRREIEQAKPVGPVDRLIQQLELAISLEDYEEAARIRDQISRLRGDSSSTKVKATRPT